MFGSFLPSLWSLRNHSLLGSEEPTLLCNHIGTGNHMNGLALFGPSSHGAGRMLRNPLGLRHCRTERLSRRVLEPVRKCVVVLDFANSQARRLPPEAWTTRRDIAIFQCGS